MSLRQMISSNPAVVAVIAIAVMVAAVVFMFTGNRTASARQAWYYDVGSAELFAHDSKAIPPIAAPSGKAGVRAHVYACGQCTNDNRRILYLETLDSKSQKSLVADPSADPIKWYSLDSEEGIALASALTEMMNECGQGNLEMCAP